MKITIEVDDKDCAWEVVCALKAQSRKMDKNFPGTSLMLWGVANQIEERLKRVQTNQ